MAISKILIANRGEIACRIIRTAKQLGIATLAVYSEADANAPHVQAADESVCIGAAAAAQSYLRGDVIIAAALEHGADAIHPGYGFLSENGEFAAAVAAAGIIFIGAPANAINKMGNKAEAKRLMIAADVPCVAGYQDTAQDDKTLLAAGAKIGFPLMVKAAAGGGGRGMRLVSNSEELAASLESARSEAQNAFGSGELILEQAVQQPRHIEVQVFADTHGNVIHLGERDCSVQRRHQKVIEESPCPIMTQELREQMGAAAVAAAKSIDYVGAGTIEFLLDKDGGFYFLEMNTRLQVEHPVTEMVTGLDLVALQIRVAEGAPLPLTQSEVALQGSSLEVRLYAEDPAKTFLPCTGRVELFAPFEGANVRYDSGITSGQDVSPFYDPMLAKLITHGDTREAARLKMIEALRETCIFGLTTNRDFLIACLCDANFAAGEFSTAFIAETFGDKFTPTPIAPQAVVALAVRHFIFDRAAAASAAISAPAALNNFTADTTLTTPYLLEIEGEEFAVQLSTSSDNIYTASLGEESFNITTPHENSLRQILYINDTPHLTHAAKFGDIINASVEGRSLICKNLLTQTRSQEAKGDGRTITAPMHGRVVEINVGVGDKVQIGDRLAIVEAMKMQHEITAQINGVVAELLTATDAQVAADDILIKLEEEK